MIAMAPNLAGMADCRRLVEPGRDHASLRKNHVWKPEQKPTRERGTEPFCLSNSHRRISFVESSEMGYEMAGQQCAPCTFANACAHCGKTGEIPAI
jgi:hypothetical protein